jgi:hypothetical protein
VLQETLTRHHIRLTDEGERFICLYGAVRCAASAKAIRWRISAPKMWRRTCATPRAIWRDDAAAGGQPLSPAEEEWLCVHLAARQVQDVDPETISADDDEALVNYILRYINSQYNYNLLDDAQLHADLLTHIKTMITRVRYQIMIPNPLLDNIKQHYPMAWDMTLAAVSSWGNTRRMPSAKTKSAFWCCISASGWSATTTLATSVSRRCCWCAIPAMRWCG